jgi:hypothetical protein
VEEHLTSKHEALNSNPSTAKKQTNERTKHKNKSGLLQYFMGERVGCRPGIAVQVMKCSRILGIF